MVSGRDKDVLLETVFGKELMKAEENANNVAVISFLKYLS